MALWTDVAQNPGVAVEGLLVSSEPGGTNSYIAETAVRAGFLVEFGTDSATTQNQVQPLAALPAADPNAITTATASAINGQALTAVGDLDGVIGLGKIYPPQNITATFDADAGHDGPLGFVVHTVYGEDAAGNPIQEDMIHNNDGGAGSTLSTRQCFSRVSQIDVGASNAATGTITFGVAPNHVALSCVDMPGIACYDVAREPSATAAVTFDANETLCCVKKGLVWAVATDAVTPGEPVFVRVIAGGGVLRGALYGNQETPSGGSFARLLGATWKTAAGASALGLVELV